MKAFHNALVCDTPPKDQRFQRCVGELVTAQAAANTQALAVAHGSAVLTYGELEASANQMAHLLLSLGLEPEATVGLCLGHSLNFVIAALGILKAGGAYLPLDPTYPLERLTLMLKDAGALFLVRRAILPYRTSRSGPPGARKRSELRTGAP